MIAFLLATLFASYALQRSSGAPLVTAGKVDTANVRTLATFNIAALESTPWARDGNGNPRTDVPLLLRKLNPSIKLMLYVQVDHWLPPGFPVPPTDSSGFAMAYRAIDGTGGWLYGTDGQVWTSFYRVNLGKRETADAIGDVLLSLLSTRLYDWLFLDCTSPSIAWTNNGARKLDFKRAGFSSLNAMDSARAVNIARIIARVHAAGCYTVVLNGTGPAVGQDVDFREGLASLISVQDAQRWVSTPGTHWLKAECYYPSECSSMASLLRVVAAWGSNVIVSLGPDRDWPPLRADK